MLFLKLDTSMVRRCILRCVAAGRRPPGWRIYRGRLYAGPLAEQGVRLVEEENPVFTFRLGKEVVEVLLRLSDVFGDHHR